MDKFINVLYWFFWILGFFILAVLAYKICTIDNNTLYISAVAILISAFLASLSMIKSIRNSKLIETRRIKKEEETLILHFEYLLLVLFDKTERFSNEFPTFIERVSKINKKYESLESETLALSNDFFFLSLIERKKQFNAIKIELENPELYKYIDIGNRMVLVELCIKLSEIEIEISMIINSKSTSESILNMSKIKLEKLIKYINKLIKLQKRDLEKNHPSDSLFKFDEYFNNYESEKQ